MQGGRGQPVGSGGGMEPKCRPLKKGGPLATYFDRLTPILTPSVFINSTFNATVCFLHRKYMARQDWSTVAESRINRMVFPGLRIFISQIFVIFTPQTLYG